MELLKGMDVSVDNMLVCGGGATSPLWRQMLADVYGCDVRTVASEQGPAVGAAILAGVGSGVYSSVQEACSRVIRTNPPEQPNGARSAAYEKYYRVYRQLYPALKDSFTALSQG